MKEVELVTEKMVFEGKALARMDRFVVFVEGALPGERVRAVITTKKRQFAAARVVEILEPSPHRKESDCPLFGECGGCTFRHCDYAAQLQFKQEVFTESMHGVQGVPERVQPILGMEPPAFYRNKMIFTFGQQEGVPVIGLHRRNNFYHIVHTDNCLLQSPESADIVRRTLEFVKSRQIPVFDERTKTGLLRTLMIREGKHTRQRLVQINATDYPAGIEQLTDIYGDLCDTLIVGLDRRVSGPPRPVELKILKGRGMIEEKLNGLTFEIRSETFFQTNTIQAERLFQELMKQVGTLRPKLALDLYSGVGPIAMHLSPVAEQVVGVESVDESVKAAEQNVARNGLQNVKMICAAVEKAGPDVLPSGADLVVVDPPRPGLHEKAVQKIVALAAENLIYISCNPATLARDLKLFTSSGYEVMHIQPIDMFPHTFHIEALTVLKKR
ncbi:MAG TPA: 23S rRNA (uracil(1939)-C(5))-methyltransferase RlmD [Verrucomicrobia bacterium]|nr:MAG: 23S rRNA (uracil-5-)-methyltransferase RumA [Lentisphaerae bacterium GWF2_57_35]HBA85227.1 23S rRNA (uracil(1939)-C(5))-methyltransferase RlmD [Verrucomicrobiota bacterium]